jgi:hypothetical protein
MARHQDHWGEFYKFDTPNDGLTFSVAVANRVWDPINMVWVNAVQGGGGGSGPVTQGTVPWVSDELQYALRFDAATSPILYLGQALPGALDNATSWRIQRFNVASGVISQWANGAATFINAWTDRAIIAYS